MKLIWIASGSVFFFPVLREDPAVGQGILVGRAAVGTGGNGEESTLVVSSNSSD